MLSIPLYTLLRKTSCRIIVSRTTLKASAALSPLELPVVFVPDSVGNHPIEPNRAPGLDAIVDFLAPIGWDYQDCNRDCNP
jgi:hypothetical protein